MKKNSFQSPTKGEISVPKMIQEISSFVADDPKSFYRLVIGTDSHIRRNGQGPETTFVTAIVIHRAGNGAKYFWKKDIVHAKPVLRDKI